MRVCVCVGFSSVELCCQAYRKWIIQIGFAKWIFIETVARHFVAVAVCFCSCCLYFVPNDFCTSCPYIFSSGFYFFLFCVWVTIFRNLMWPVARFSVRPVARFVCVTVSSWQVVEYCISQTNRTIESVNADISICVFTTSQLRCIAFIACCNRYIKILNSNALLVFIT